MSIGARTFVRDHLTARDVAPITIGDDVWLGGVTVRPDGGEQLATGFLRAAGALAISESRVSGSTNVAVPGGVLLRV